MDQMTIKQAFVDALARRLMADRDGNVTPAICSACANARAAAHQALSDEEYYAAMKEAFHAAGQWA
jgi:hypothetical protein